MRSARADRAAPVTATAADRAAGTGADPVTILSVVDLSVAYQTRRGDVGAVEHVSFDLDRGEFLGIVGESGCG